jgi:hypothetical protein
MLAFSARDAAVGSERQGATWLVEQDKRIVGA